MSTALGKNTLHVNALPIYLHNRSLMPGKNKWKRIAALLARDESSREESNNVRTRVFVTVSDIEIYLSGLARGGIL